LNGGYIFKIIFFSLICFNTFSNSLSIISYNLENLFDSKHDPSHKDYEFLPRSHKLKERCKTYKARYQKRCLNLDWTSNKVEKKIRNLKRVLKSTAHIPDFLALIEIENITLVKKFENLIARGKSLITTGQDFRGIQCALIYNSKKYKLIDTREIETYPGTRNILEAEFQSKSGKVFIFVNHWPSQRSVNENRVFVSEKLRSRILQINNKEKDKRYAIIVTGDFNTLKIESPHPFHNVLLYKTGMKDAANKIFGGSYFFKPTMSWNLLDRIFYSTKNLKLKGFHILNPDFSTTITEYRDPKKLFWGSRVTGIPKRFKLNSKRGEGYSDHFPVLGLFIWDK